MSNSLFAQRDQRQQPNRRNNGGAQLATTQLDELGAAVRSIMSMVRGQDPQKFLQALCMRDPQIRDTVQRWEGMSTEQICAECGVDYGWLRTLIK